MSMKKVSVTYKAPKDDSKVCTIYGHTLHDGKAEEIEAPAAVIEKLRNNGSFTVGEESDVDHNKDQVKAKARAG